MSIEIESLLREYERRAELKLHLMNLTIKHPELARRHDDLRRRGLELPMIREQVLEAVRQNKTTTQLVSIITYIFQLHTAIVEGERLPALTSPFSKLPFLNAQ